MDDLMFGVRTMLVGMGAVLGMLLLLTLLVWALGRSDRPRAVAAEPPLPSVDSRAVQSGLTADQIAAITIAVTTHARVRRSQAAPETRTHEPGSHLFASRWVASGRTRQNQSWQRR